MDFLLIAGAALLSAIALAARTWVKTQEPTEVAIRRRDETLEAWNALRSENAQRGNTPPPDVIATADPREDGTR